MKALKNFLLIILSLKILIVSVFSQPLYFEVEKLKNGLNLYYQKDPDLKITTIFFFFPGGQGIEPENKAGLSYLTIRLMSEIPDEGKLFELVAAGVNLSAGSRPDYSFVQLDCLSISLEKALKIISASLKNPLFSGLRIEAIKKILLSEANKESCRLIDSAKICLRQHLFPNSPYSFSLFGTESTLKTINKKDITRFYEEITQSDNLSLIVISDLDKETISSMVLKYLSEITRPARKFETAEQREKKFDKQIELANKIDLPGNCSHYQGPSGAAVLLAHVFPGSAAEIYPAAYLIEKIIGEGPGSVLWKLRQENALAYNLNSQLEIIGNKVILLSYLETENRQIATALDSLKAVFNQFYQNGLSGKEIETGKLLAKSCYLRESFSRDARLERLALFLANNLPADLVNQFPQAIDNLSPFFISNLIRSTFRPEAAAEIIISRD